MQAVLEAQKALAEAQLAALAAGVSADSIPVSYVSTSASSSSSNREPDKLIVTPMPTEFSEYGRWRFGVCASFMGAAPDPKAANAFLEIFAGATCAQGSADTSLNRSRL